MDHVWRAAACLPSLGSATPGNGVMALTWTGKPNPINGWPGALP